MLDTISIKELLFIILLSVLLFLYLFSPVNKFSSTFAISPGYIDPAIRPPHTLTLAKSQNIAVILNGHTAYPKIIRGQAILDGDELLPLNCSNDRCPQSLRINTGNIWKT